VSFVKTELGPLKYQVSYYFAKISSYMVSEFSVFGYTYILCCNY